MTETATTSAAVRVLAVEDERIVARDLQLRLNKLGYEVAGIAASAGQAIDLAGELRPSIVLMDIRLRGEPDGIEAGRIIRERYGLPVIYLTAHSDERTLARARETQPFGYLLKPFQDRELHAAIQIALERHQREKEERESSARQAAARRVAQFALASTEPAPLLEQTCAAVAAVLGAAHVAVLEYDGERDHLVVRAGRGAIRPGSVEPVAPYVAALYAEPRARVLDAPELRSSGLARAQGCESGVCAVIPGRERPFGILAAWRMEAAGFSEADSGFLQNLADTLGSAIERHRTLAELERVNGELRNEVERRRELQEQLVHSQKMEALGRLAGGIAHDFNNILTAICGYNELLTAGLEGQPKLQGYSQEVRNAAGRAVSLAGQMLSFSRRQPFHPQVVDLNEVVAHIGKMLQRVIGEEIRVRTRLAPNLARVKADRAQIDQVLLNLAVNSRDAMPNGGTITIETANSVLPEGFPEGRLGAPAGNYVMLSVSDTGVGMDAETSRRAFEPFFTTKQPGKGTGLGLSIVYGIVSQSGGEIALSSEPGRGTTVQIFLPATSGEAVEPRRTEVVEAATRGAGTILLVEDDDNVRGFLRSMLTNEGYSVVAAANPDEALRLAGERRGAIDLVITDVVMPGMSGIEFAGRLRKSGQKLRILFMSGYADRGVETSGDAVPGSQFIQKPFTAAAMAKKVREALKAKP